MSKTILLIYTVLLLALAGVAVHSASLQPFVTSEKLDGYRLVFHDEFNGKSLDTKTWYHRKGVRLQSNQLPENVSVTGGNLRLELKKQKTAGSEYTAGGVISRERFRYGYYEARFKCPPGGGWHTSFWLYWYSEDTDQQPTGSKQEIDICENNSADLRRFTTNFHTWLPGHKDFGAKPVKTPDLSADYHIYGCEVTPQQARFFFDGRLVGVRDISGRKIDDMSIWLTSVAWGKPDESKLPSYALYDWVRYYEKVGGYREDTKLPATP